MKIVIKQMIKEDKLDQLIFQEISVLQRVEHNCIVKLIEVLEDSTNFYFIMELLAGKDLEQMT